MPIVDPQKAPDAPQEPDAEVAKGEPQEPEQAAAHAFTPIVSQEEFDKTLGKRLAAERAKYAGFDDLKAKASKYDELEEAKKTQEQRLSEQMTAIRTENAELKLDKLRTEIAHDKGLPPKWAKRLTGTTREEIEADADDLADTLPQPEPRAVLSRKPRENLRGGGRPDDEPEETDPRKLAAKIPR